MALHRHRSLAEKISGLSGRSGLCAGSVAESRLVTHTSSFAVHLACQPDSDIDYVACQSAVVSLRQHNQILATALVQKIDTHGQLLELCFDFEDLTAPVELIIETHHDHDQFNKDNPIAVTQLICDDLFTVPWWWQ